ncbi:MAG: sigma-54 dependent transcriptional regulator [Nitrospira sp.]
MAKPKVLIIEDDETIAAALQSAFQDECEVFVTGQNSATGIEEQEWEPRVTLLGLESSAKPNPEDGVRLLQELRRSGHRGKMIVYTSSAERSIAVRAVRCGASEVLSKPLDVALLKGIVRRAARIADLEQEAQAGMTDGGHEAFAGMLGTSSGMQRIFEAIQKASTNDAPILIAGESGTGKELTAKAIHDRGLRKQAPFVPINCGAIPENLLESELFGYERGAVTGAVSQNKGKVEFAQGGTLFLDEVGELPVALQVKLLRFLQDRTFERVGGHQRIEMNVRIIAATNVNLQDAIEKGTFREDLYYRLGVVHINLLPLRERGEDVVFMATAFLRQAAAHYEKPIRGFTREALEAMRAYTWPGNVRELTNRVGRAVVMAEGTHIGPVDLDIPHQAPRPDESSICLKLNQQRIETDLIMKAFTLSQGNLSRAAHELGISRSTLYRRLRQYGMDRALDARRTLGASPRAWLSEH